MSGKILSATKSALSGKALKVTTVAFLWITAFDAYTQKVSRDRFVRGLNVRNTVEDEELGSREDLKRLHEQPTALEYERNRLKQIEDEYIQQMKAKDERSQYS